MQKVVMQTAEPESIREATEIMVKIIDVTYAKIDLEQVSSNAVYMEHDEIIKLLSLLN